MHPTDADHAVDLLVGDIEDLENDLHAAVVGQAVGFVDACNALSVRVAERLLDGSLDYDSANCVMDWVWSYITGWLVAIEGSQCPEPACSIYDAVDAGEYRHQGDSMEVDPVVRYAIPALSAIIESLE